MHEPGVEPLRILAAEIMRSRPPTEALGSSDHGPRLEDAHAEAKRSRVAWGPQRGSAELGLLAEQAADVLVHVEEEGDWDRGGEGDEPKRRVGGRPIEACDPWAVVTIEGGADAYAAEARGR